MFKRDKTNRNNTEKGFSVIEMAFVIVIIGALMVPILGLLQNYEREEKVETNKEKLSSIVLAITNFENIYGYYPAPASGFASLGDDEYGHSVADVGAIPYNTCTDGVCHVPSVAGDPNAGVAVGAIPFKTLNLSEDESLDEYGSRIVYGVSRTLTDPETFEPNGGVIEIRDENGESVVTPPASVNFVVVSLGPNRIGATTKEGFQVASNCTDTSGAEAENCIFIDGIFGLKEKDVDFDDDVAYYNSLSIQHWQKNDTNIHTKLDALSIGATQGTTLNGPGAPALSVVRQVGGNTTGTIYASGPVDSSVEVASNVDGLFLANDICDGANCFRPDVIAGWPTLEFGTGLFYKDGPTDEGMSCYTPGSPMQYMVGIDGGEPVCTDEVFVICPETVITGFDADGNVICAEQPPLPCEDPITHTPYCTASFGSEGAPSVPMTHTATTPHGEFVHFYSGECTDFSDPLFDSDYQQFIINQGWPGQTLAQAQAAVSAYANDPENLTDTYFCGPGPSTALVRDNFYCNDGTYEQWDTTERRNNPHFGGTLTSPTQGYPWDVENTYLGAIPPPPAEVGNHDCRCKEHIRAVAADCPEHTVGEAVRYGKHHCPQTANYYWYGYTDNSNCVCQPGPFLDTMPCHEYYNQEVSSPPGPDATSFNLQGDVQLTYNVDCSSGSPVVGPPTSVDASACQCPDPADTVSVIDCPPGTTNSWTSTTQGAQTGVAAIETTEWFCPGTQSVSSHSVSLDDPGYWDPNPPTTTETGPACTCDTSITDTVPRNCCWQPSGTTGVTDPDPCPQIGERQWNRPYICAANPLDPAVPNPDTTTWTEGSNTCQSCSWTNNGTAHTNTAVSGSYPGNNTACDCNGPTSGICSESGAGAGLEYIYNCSCVTN